MDDKPNIGSLVRLARQGKGLTQADLARKVGTNQQTIDKIEKGTIKRSGFLLPISLELDIPPDKLTPAKKPSSLPGGTFASGQIPATELVTGVRDLPIYTSARGGAGELLVSTDPYEWVSRPEPLSGVIKGYGVRIVGGSMVPEFEEGDIALVHPNLPPLGGHTCVFYSERHGEARATIKRLLSFTDAAWRVRQWSPPDGEKADFSLSRKEWALCHRVVGKYTRR